MSRAASRPNQVFFLGEIGMELKKGYMVYRKGKHGCKPRRVHPDIPTAMEEATRLAKKLPDAPYLIVEVIGCVTATAEGGVVVTTAT